MFDKIVIVLAASSLLKNSQTEMPTTEAHRCQAPTSPPQNFPLAACGPLPIQMRKDCGPAMVGELSVSLPTHSPS